MTLAQLFSALRNLVAMSSLWAICELIMHLTEATMTYPRLINTKLLLEY